MKMLAATGLQNKNSKNIPKHALLVKNNVVSHCFSWKTQKIAEARPGSYSIQVRLFMQCRVLSSRMKRIEKGFRSEKMFVAWRIALAAQARSCKASAYTSETMQYIGIFKQTPVSVDRCA
jgi:hypothetical protein